MSLGLNGQMHHIGVGRTHVGTHVVSIIHDLEVRIAHASTGELRKELAIDAAKT